MEEKLIDKEHGRARSSDERALSTPVQALSNTIKSIFGSGVLAMPYATKEAGWLSASVGLVPIALLSYYTMFQLACCNEAVRARTQGTLRTEISFRTIGGLAYGYYGTLAADVFLMGCQFGACCAFLSFVMENFNSLPGVRLEHKQMLLFLFVPIVSLLTLLRSTTYLAPAAHFGNLLFLAAYISAICISLNSHPPSLEGTQTLTGVSGLASFFGTSVFAFSAHPQVVAIEQFTKDRPGYVRVLRFSIFVAFFLYLTFALICYFCYRQDTKAVLFENLGNSDLTSAVKLAVTLMITINYPFSAFGGVQNLENIVFATRKKADDSKQNSNSRVKPLQLVTDSRKSSSSRVGIDIRKDVFCTIFVGRQRAPLRLSAIFLTAVVAGTVADFGFLTALTGSLCNGFVAFVLPPLFYMRLCAEKLEPWVVRANWALVAGGAVFSISSALLLIVKKAQQAT